VETGTWKRSYPFLTRSRIPGPREPPAAGAKSGAALLPVPPGALAARIRKQARMERLVLKIEKGAFSPLFPLLAKPRLELGIWPHSKRPILSLSGRKPFSKTSSRKGNRKGMESPVTTGRAIPLDSQSVGSILMILPEGFACGLKKLLHESYRVLDEGGKIAIGFVPRESLWGRFYRDRRSRVFLTPKLRIYSLKEMEHRMMEAGFSIQGYLCTLFQRPGEAKEFEKPFRGYRFQAGFLVLLGERRARDV
jgi:hypothetical protein